MHRASNPRPPIENTITRLKQDVRIQNWVNNLPNSEKNNDAYIPGLYIKSDFVMNPGPDETENNLFNFARNYTTSTTIYTKFTNTHINLNRMQRAFIKRLSTDHRFIIVLADKNLGPCIIERVSYLTMCFQDHLLKPTYQQLIKTEADNMVSEVQCSLSSAISKYSEFLSEAETVYFQRAL